METRISEKAVEAARWAYDISPVADSLGDALEAAYPIIRAEVIAEVVEALRDYPTGLHEKARHMQEAAAFIEHKFGAES
jgi:hypothetical protein